MAGGACRPIGPCSRVWLAGTPGVSVPCATSVPRWPRRRQVDRTEKGDDHEGKAYRSRRAVTSAPWGSVWASNALGQRFITGLWVMLLMTMAGCAVPATASTPQTGSGSGSAAAGGGGQSVGPDRGSGRRRGFCHQARAPALAHRPAHTDSPAGTCWAKECGEVEG